MDIIKPENYETIPVKAEAFVIPDYNEFADDPVKYKRFLDEVNSFIGTTYKYKAEMLREKILYIHCGPSCPVILAVGQAVSQQSLTK